MNEQIEKAILFLAEKIKGSIDANDALKFTQAACNIANAGLTLANANANANKT